MEDQKAEDFIKHHPLFRAISPGCFPRLPIKAVLPQVRGKTSRWVLQMADQKASQKIMRFFEKKRAKNFCSWVMGAGWANARLGAKVFAEPFFKKRPLSS